MMAIACCIGLALQSAIWLISHRDETDDYPRNTAGNKGILFASLFILLLAIIDKAMPWLVAR